MGVTKKSRDGNREEKLGYAKLPTLFLMDSEITDGALRVLAALIGFARDKRTCWPGNKVLSKATGKSIRTIQRHLKELADLGIIVVHLHDNGSQHREEIEIVDSRFNPDPTEPLSATSNLTQATSTLTQGCDKSDVGATSNLTQLEEDNQENKSREYCALPAREPSDDGSEEAEPFETPGAILPMPVQGPGKDSDVAVALEAWALPLGYDPRGESYGFWAREQCQYMPSEWVQSILERKVMGCGGSRDGRGKSRPNVVMLSRIASDWRDAGRPEWDIHAAARADPSRRKAGWSDEDWSQFDQQIHASPEAVA